MYATLIDSRLHDNTCPICKAEMHQVEVSFHNKDYDIFMYKCSQCAHVDCLLLKRIEVRGFDKDAEFPENELLRPLEF